MGNPPRERRADDANEVLSLAVPSLSAAPPPEPAPAPPPKKEEERVPLIWRLSFGAMLSLVALVSITLYHQLNNAIVNLRVPAPGQHRRGPGG
jgi:hypothetical protein